MATPDAPPLEFITGGGRSIFVLTSTSLTKSTDDVVLPAKWKIDQHKYEINKNHIFPLLTPGVESVLTDIELALKQLGDLQVQSISFYPTTPAILADVWKLYIWKLFRNPRWGTSDTTIEKLYGEAVSEVRFESPNQTLFAAAVSISCHYTSPTTAAFLDVLQKDFTPELVVEAVTSGTAPAAAPLLFMNSTTLPCLQRLAEVLDPISTRGTGLPKGAAITIDYEEVRFQPLDGDFAAIQIMSQQSKTSDTATQMVPTDAATTVNEKPVPIKLHHTTELQNSRVQTFDLCMGPLYNFSFFGDGADAANQAAFVGAAAKRVMMAYVCVLAGDLETLEVHNVVAKQPICGDSSMFNARVYNRVMAHVQEKTKDPRVSYYSLVPNVQPVPYVICGVAHLQKQFDKIDKMLVVHAFPLDFSSVDTKDFKTYVDPATKNFINDNAVKNWVQSLVKLILKSAFLANTDEHTMVRMPFIGIGKYTKAITRDAEGWMLIWMMEAVAKYGGGRVHVFLTVDPDAKREYSEEQRKAIGNFEFHKDFFDCKNTSADRNGCLSYGSTPQTVVFVNECDPCGFIGGSGSVNPGLSEEFVAGVGRNKLLMNDSYLHNPCFHPSFANKNNWKVIAD